MLNAEFISDATFPLTVRYEAISAAMKNSFDFSGDEFSQATDKNRAEWQRNLKINSLASVCLISAFKKVVE